MFVETGGLFPADKASPFISYNARLRYTDGDSDSE